MNYKKTVLKNGVRILTTEMPQMRSVATTIYVGAGARFEDEKNNGVSHFLEHMVFKGTKKWPNQAKIARAIEGVGGQLNAWTDYEYTAYWNQVPKDYYKRAFEVLSDMLCAPLIEEQAIKKERGVIIEEINRTKDFPSSQVFDNLIGMMWPNQPLGRQILGTKKNIENMTRQQFTDYIENYYSTEAMVVSVAGNIKHEEVVEEFDKLLSNKKKKSPRESIGVVEKQEQPIVSIDYKKTDQIHLVMGIRGLSSSDPKRFAWKLMNTILGVGMSSRLFLNIREDQGLAYAIHSGDDSVKDTGLIFIQAGLNIKKLDDAIKAIMFELKKLKSEKVGETELIEAKEYIRGGLSLSMDDTDSVSSWYGRQELLMPEVMTTDEIIERIEKVTVEDIINIAKEVFVEKNVNLAMIGPIKDENRFAEMLKM